MKPKIFRPLALVALLHLGISLHAQETTLGRNTWDDQQTNAQENVRYGSANPTRLAFNTQHNTAYAQADLSLRRGSFHAADQSGKRNDMNFFFGGLKQLKKIDLAGSLRYENIQARQHAWNSTYALEQDNPFIIADSVEGHTTIEAFYLNATAAYTLNDKWCLALQVDIQTAASSDQNDPRPKVNTTILPFTAGAEWKATETFALGLNAGIRVYNSDMAYTVVNNRVSYPYFLMKGMGDQRNLNTGSETGYKRDYHGFAYNAALQGVWQETDGKWADFLQLSAERGFQDAKDGGSSYTFRGGDYDFTKLRLQNRLQLRPSKDILHQVFLEGAYLMGEGTWYDQRRIIDTEHNNRVDYIILANSKLHKPSRISADLKYRFTTQHANGSETSVSASVGAERFKARHLTDDGYLTQECTLAHFQADARHAFTLKKGILNVAFGGGYWMPIGDKKFDTAAEAGTSGAMITRRYVAPQFEYLSASHYRTSLMADYNLPLHGETLALGIFAKVDYARYCDDAEYSDRFKSTSFTTSQVGLYLQF
ncbi:MAG: hypothetical protein K5945_07430 [Bacteroidaceae bacterium]|nr:hypothetical protein [Bacteroidaceae bacterium]